MLLYSSSSMSCFLRASGGVSARLSSIFSVFWFSPRKRRCFCEVVQPVKVPHVFSAQAEVFPTSIATGDGSFCFLRASGGVSYRHRRNIRLCWFSPRKRRCFYFLPHFPHIIPVFSAQAEVFLQSQVPAL